MKITANDVGFYSSAEQPIDQPSYDPPHDAPCPYCGLPITPDDVRTISVMYVGNVRVNDEDEIGGVGNFRARSYFYQTHRTCAALALDAERHALDDMVFETIEALPSQEGATTDE